MASAQVTIRTTTGGGGGKTYASLDAWIDDVAKKIPLILPAVALEELDAQKQKGQTPSNILVDGRPSTESMIANATRRVQMFFLDVEQLARAVEMAFSELHRLYHRQTGASAATIQIWGRTAKGGGIRHERLSSIGSVREWLTANRASSTYIRLIGPDVPFRRALYYSPPGGKSTFRNVSRVSDKRLKELERGGAKARVVKAKRRALVQVQASQNVSEIVTKRLTSSFGKSIYVSARWIAVPVPPWKGARKRRQGVPAVAIGWRFGGVAR